MPTHPKLRRKDRIETLKEYRGAIQYGMVVSVTNGKVRVLLDDGVTVVTGPMHLFQYSNRPLPDVFSNIYKKGERVSFKSKDGELLGVVKSGAFDLVEIIVDGGVHIYSVHPSYVKRSDIPLVKDTIVTPMDDYEVRGWKEVAGHDDTLPYVANIYKNGCFVANASNDGWGGSDSIQGRSNQAVEQLYKDAEAWAVAFGEIKPIEPISAWIFWYANLRPYGVTAEAHIGKRIKDRIPS